MRPYNAFETRNVKFLVDKQVEFATIQITATGLKKSILDATAPVRAYFKEKVCMTTTFKLRVLNIKEPSTHIF